MVQSFPDVYTSYCDCVKFVRAVNGEYYLLTRGSELVSDDSKQTSKCRYRAMKRTHL